MSSVCSSVRAAAGLVLEGGWSTACCRRERWSKAVCTITLEMHRLHIHHHGTKGSACGGVLMVPREVH